MTFYIHETRGRIRIRTPHLRGNPYQADAIARLLQQTEGVMNVSVRPLTGSIVVHFDPDIVGLERLFHLLSHRGLIFPLTPVRRPHLALVRDIPKFA